MARVRGVMAASSLSGLRLWLVDSTSTSTKRAPVWLMAAVVAMSLFGTVMTSSPGPISRPFSIKNSAAVPDCTAIACIFPPRRFKMKYKINISYFNYPNKFFIIKNFKTYR